MDKVDVLAVMESCRDRYGMLDDTGRCIESAIRQEYVWRAAGMDEAADEAKAYAESLAFNRKAADDSLLASCRVPVTMLGRAPRRRSRVSPQEAR